MQIFNSYSDYSKTVFKYMKKGVFTNNFQDKAELEWYISNGKLSFFEIENNLFILRKKNGFSILNYYINLPPDNSTSNFENTLKTYFDANISDKLVVEEVKKAVAPTLPQDFFPSLGFEKQLDRVRLILKNTTDDFIENTTLSNSNIVFEYDAVKVQAFLYDNFHKYYGCIQDIDVIKDSINKKNIYLYVENGLLLGVLDSKSNAKVSEIRHLAVDKASRGKGIGNILLETYLQSNTCKTKTVWTGYNNTSAISLYKKYGYTDDEYSSSVYIKN